MATCIVPHLGHERTSELVRECLKEGKIFKDFLIERQIFSEKELESIIESSRSFQTLEYPELE
jgi:aspartate ammonia-lyase